MTSLIRAAGVVMLRDGDHGPEFLMVHRPHREDWSLPKGKLEPGEHVVAAAARECDEETGYTPRLTSPLPPHEYLVEGVPKVVHYWRATVADEDGFAPDDEVDEARWAPVATAADELTYPNEGELVATAAALPETLPLVIVRHTKAVKRSDFHGAHDADRPLSGQGRSQSKALVPLLAAFGIDTVYSSSARRCEETVRRFAKQARTKVRSEPRLSEEGHEANPKAAAKRAAALAVRPRSLVVCTHRPVLPTVLDAVIGALGIDPDDARWAGAWDPKLPPGGFVVVHRAFDENGGIRVVAVERHQVTGE
jgi:8-oxo-dGTP diphosphatase